MKLEKYNKKRNFLSTNEPIGKVEQGAGGRFVVQYHEARAKHYDFRLEHDGVLLSWAVPKGFSYDLSAKRLAVQVEDHPLDYINFEGVIPKGNYGAGTVQIFDKGEYDSLYDMDYALKKGHLMFVLHGKRLKGKWSLLKTDEKNWLLMKLKDEFESGNLELKQPKNPFKSCDVMLATLVKSVPKGKDYAFEIKYDGYRILAFGESGKVKLLTRNGKDYTKKFSKCVRELEILAEKYTFVLDGEMVAFDENGRSDFGLLQGEIKKNGKIFYQVFDILAFQGEDLREKTLLERKKMLKNLINGDFLLYSEYVLGNGQKVFEFAKQNNLEGVIAKKISSKYTGQRDENWLKIKCRHRQEFVVAGYTITDKNPILSALVLGVFENGKLSFVGKVGTGFDDKKRAEIQKKLSKITKKTPNFDLKGVIWTKPEIVVEIEFAELTKDKILRQPSFIGIREDKKPEDVHLEIEND